jgi:hypothetical protein
MWESGSSLSGFSSFGQSVQCWQFSDEVSDASSFSLAQGLIALLVVFLLLAVWIHGLL